MNYHMIGIGWQQGCKHVSRIRLLLPLYIDFEEKGVLFNESSDYREIFKVVLKVTVHLQTDHFVEILIFRLMHRSKHELSSKKKIQKY